MRDPFGTVNLTSQFTCTSNRTLYVFVPADLNDLRRISARIREIKEAPAVPPPLTAVASAPSLSNAPTAQKLHSTSSPALNDAPPARPAPRLPAAEQSAQGPTPLRSPAAPERETSNPKPPHASPPKQRVAAAHVTAPSPAPATRMQGPPPPPPETLLTALTRTLDEAMVSLRSACEVRYPTHGIL